MLYIMLIGIFSFLYNIIVYRLKPDVKLITIIYIENLCSIL